MPKKKLPSPKSKPKEKTSAQLWLERIDRALKVKEQWRDMFRIPLGYEYWEGRQRPASVPTSEWVTINLIYSNLMSLLPTLYNTNPYFYVKLKRSYAPDPMRIALYEQRGKIRQSMINYLKEELELKSKMRLSICDAIFQFGVFKVHYEAKLVENPDGDEPMKDDAGMIITDDEGEIVREPKYIPVEDAYKLTRIHPDDFVVDEDAGPLNEDVTWKAQRVKMRLSDAKKDKRFKASARRNLKATEISDPIQAEREQKKKGAAIASADGKVEPDVCVLWEIYNIKDDEWMIVADGSSEFLIDPEPVPEGIEHDPFIDLRFTPRDDAWYPIPPVSQWIDPQREYCDLRSKIAVHRKRFNRKYLAYIPALEDPVGGLSQLEVGDDGTIVRTNQPGEAITPIRDAPLDQTHIQELGLLRDELTLLSIGPNQRGSGRGVESATEASVIEKRLQIQEGDWIALVIDFVQQVAEKLDQLIQEKMTTEQAIKVSGPQGEYWEVVRPRDYEEIEGEYEYSVNVGATTPRLPEIERAQWLAFLNLLASAPQLALSKRLLKHQAELHHIDDEVLIDEIYSIAQKMMSGALPMPGQQGSVPGQPGRPGTATMGEAMGMPNMPGGMGA